MKKSTEYLERKQAVERRKSEKWLRKSAIWKKSQKNRKGN